MSSLPTNFASLFDQALLKRRPLIASLEAEGTDAYRLFHGTGEGVPGLTIDQYGPLVLLQTFRDPLSAEERDSVEALLAKAVPGKHFVYNHRGKRAGESFDQWHQPKPEALAEVHCHEFGATYKIRARHAGIDPWLFLDLRAGRRYIRETVKGLSVLNLFSYTCSVGITAATSGASEVLNVDFAASNLRVGYENSVLNKIEEKRFKTLQEDCIPVMRQLAALPAGGRRGKTPKATVVPPRSYHVVFLDPPAWSKGMYGAVDVENDYASLFKPAALIVRPGGGRVIATNHVASVTMEAWTDSLRRIAEKAGRPIQSLNTLTPEDDFPSFDGRHPLKIAVCEF